MSASQGNTGKRRLWFWITATILVAIIGSCVAAVGFYGDTRETNMKRAFISEALSAWIPFRDYFGKFGKLPATPQEVGVNPHYEVNWDVLDTKELTKFSRDLSVNQDSITIVFMGISKKGQATLIFRPVANSTPVVWDCTGGTLEEQYRPPGCRQSR